MVGNFLIFLRKRSVKFLFEVTVAPLFCTQHYLSTLRPAVPWSWHFARHFILCFQPQVQRNRNYDGTPQDWACHYCGNWFCVKTTAINNFKFQIFFLIDILVTLHLWLHKFDSFVSQDTTHCLTKVFETFAESCWKIFGNFKFARDG